MRRNSGLIGDYKVKSAEEASGVHDTFDVFNAERSNAWPQVQKVLTITNSNGTSLPESQISTFTVTTSGIDDFVTLYYEVVLVSGTTLSNVDFDSGSPQGTFTINSNSGTFNVEPVGDDIAESDVVKIVIRRGSHSGDILIESGNLTVTDAAAPALSPGTYVIFTNTATNSTSDANIMNSYYRRYVIGFTYTAAELQASDSDWSNSGISISGLSFNVVNPTGASYNPYPNYAIAMCHIPNGTSTTNPTSSTSRTDFTTVKSQHDASFTASGTKTFTFDNNFTYNGTDALGIIFAWGRIPTNYSRDGQSYYVNSGRMYYSRTDSSGTYTVSGSTSQTSQTKSYRPIVDLIVG